MKGMRGLRSAGSELERIVYGHAWLDNMYVTYVNMASQEFFNTEVLFFLNGNGMFEIWHLNTAPSRHTFTRVIQHFIYE